MENQGNNIYKTVSQILTQSRNILLVSHIHPDGDAVGALTALGTALLDSGQAVTLYNEHPVPPAYRFLPMSDKITQEPGDLSAYDVAVVLDCSKIERIGTLSETIDQIPVIINIDHHCTNEKFGGIQLVAPQMCATTEIVFRLITEMGHAISQTVAYGIYTGIITDTASFSFNNTSAEAFIICGQMIQAGVDPQVVSKNVYITYTSERIRFMQMVLDTFILSPDKKISFMMGTQEMIRKSGMKPENVGRIVNYAKHIENVKIAAMALEEEHQPPDLPPGQANFHISLRSDGSVDVSRIAVSFGGGGHSSAAGFNLADTASGIKDTIFNLSNRI